MGAKILAIDDAADGLELLRILLKTHFPDVAVHTAAGGRTGLDTAQRERPDVILLDVLMPDINGLEVCRALKSDPRTGDIPILLLSGIMIEAKHRATGLSAGADGYLRKPFEGEELVAQVKALLRLKRSQDRLRAHEQELQEQLDRRTRTLIESEKRFRSIFEHSPDAIFVESEDGCVLDVNPAACALHGLAREELVGRRVFDLVPPDQAEAVRRDFGKWISGELTCCEGTSRAQDGREVPVEIRGSAISYDGKACVLLQVRDTSRRKQLEEQLIHARKMESIGRLAGGIAHDFNNLLTSVLGFGRLLLDEVAGNPAALEDVHEILRAGERAAELTRKLLAVGRRQMIQIKPVDLNRVVEEMAQMLRRTLGEDIQLISELERDVPWIKADVGQTEQIIMNLTANARDAMPHGGTLTVRTVSPGRDGEEAGRHRRRPGGEFVQLSVRDTGCGMTREVREHAFEPFFTTKSMGKGTGLGLSTVYGIVEQFDGDVAIDSAPGEGTEVRILFPVAHQAPPDASIRPDDETLPRGSETILLVEDEESVRHLTVRFLAGQGYLVLAASCGPEALKHCAGRADPIHLLLTDVVMPGMSGPRLAGEVRHARPQIRVLYTTGFTEDTTLEHGLARAEIDLLPKPYRRETLLRRVREVLDA